MPESLYIHIPFCLRKCGYCDFVSIPFDEALSERYVAALIREMRQRGRMKLKTLYIGGGTPTVLSVEELNRLLKAINGNFDFLPDAEKTIEANPATVDEAKLKTLIKGGVNRISIGAQSFDGPELKTLGRLHTARDAAEAVRLARRAGFENISLDLIYGIPGQTADSWQRTLSEAIALRPDHISAYELTLEKCTPLCEQVERGELCMPSEEEASAMSELCLRTLKEAGYLRYEVSNYALAGRQCLHNLNYWRRGEYIGLGAAAHSFMAEARWRNTEGILEYIESIEREELPEQDREPLATEQRRREFLLLGLRLHEGVLLEEAEKSYGLDLMPAADELIEEGLLSVSGGRLGATDRGLSVLNELLVRLFEALRL
jgi:oxygen-independent coproporphyrinogen-3 oxidase